MSMPNIPNIAPIITLTQNESINLLLASIAFEELGLAHIINAEAEKIQSILGTLEGLTPGIVPLEDLLGLDEAVEDILERVIAKEIILLFKLDNILDFIDAEEAEEEDEG